MAAKVGSFRHSFIEKSKERLLSRKGYSEFGLNCSDGVDEPVKCLCFRWRTDAIVNCRNRLRDTVVQLYEMAWSDPRKVYFAAKMGLSLAIVTLFIFLRKDPLRNFSAYLIWGNITVVVVFEFSIGTDSDSYHSTRVLGLFNEF